MSTRRLPFQYLLHQDVGEAPTPFPGLLHFTLALYHIMLIVKQGSIKYHFLSLLYDSTRDWTPVSRTIGEHSNHYANGQVNMVEKCSCAFKYIYIYIYIYTTKNPRGRKEMEVNVWKTVIRKDSEIVKTCLVWNYLCVHWRLPLCNRVLYTLPQIKSLFFVPPS